MISAAPPGACTAAPSAYRKPKKVPSVPFSFERIYIPASQDKLLYLWRFMLPLCGEVGGDKKGSRASGFGFLMREAIKHSVTLTLLVLYSIGRSESRGSEGEALKTSDKGISVNCSHRAV